LPDQVVIEAAISWSAAAGCAFYLSTMFRDRARSGPLLFLVLLLAALLTVRGFGWLRGDGRLTTLSFAFATWLPLAVTLFIERVLRRHHPLWVKLLALGTSSVFFLSNLIPGLFSQRLWMQAFGVCFAVVLVVNGALLLAQRNSSVSAAERRLIDLLLLVALISAPLVLSDFRTLLPVFPMRLGGLAALLFVYAMLGSVVLSLGVVQWLLRFATLLLSGFILSMLLAFALQGLSARAWWRTSLDLWPLAFAWMLLTGVVVSRLALAASGRSNAFLNWLASAPLESASRLLSDLGRAPDSSAHLVLRGEDLRDYAGAVLTRLALASDGVVSLSAARRTQQDPRLAESAEQWMDLLERAQMTHGFIACPAPLCIVLVSLPATTSTAAAEARLRVLQRVLKALPP
jgi:hypothetical protein